MILQRHCMIYPEYFDRDECMRIHAEANKVEEIQGRTGMGVDPDENPEQIAQDFSVRQSSQKWLRHHSFPKDIQEKISSGIRMAQEEANWLHDWNYIEDHQYTIYRHQPDKPTGDFYTWHTDASEALQSKDGIRKISSTIQLSDPEEYEGGHFQWLEPAKMFDNIRTGSVGVDIEPFIQTAPFSAKAMGTLIVFPSCVWHQVTPVTAVTRTSFVSWYHGPRYV